MQVFQHSYIVIILHFYIDINNDLDFKKNLCYIARIYRNQLTTNEEYSKVKKVIGITLFKDNSYKDMLEDYKLVDKINKIKIKEE